MTSSTVQKNQFGDPLPRMVSQVTWVPTANSLPPIQPSRLSYEDWLCCAANVDWGCKAITCQAGDPFAGSRRWSPRRDHSAVTVRNPTTNVPNIVVIGGRALGFSTNTDEVANGGVVGGVINGVGHLRSQLMNDVWASQDGVFWTVRSPGCSVPTAKFMTGRGSKSQQCTSDADCVTGSRFGSRLTVQCVSQRCQCQSWPQRERHVASVMNNIIYITGGVTVASKHKCATLSCGGGYRVFLNDVWASYDMGLTWVEVLPNAPWNPRADHTVTVSPVSSSVTGYQFWLLAGRGGIGNAYNDNPMFNDVWVSEDGVTWVNQTTPPWGQRAGAQLIYGVETTFDSRNVARSTRQLLLIGGEELIPPSPSPSPLSLPEQAAAAALDTVNDPSVSACN